MKNKKVPILEIGIFGPFQSVLSTTRQKFFRETEKVQVH